MHAVRSPQFYFVASTTCLLLAAGLVTADARQLAAVTGAANCKTPCYEDSFQKSECLHYNPPDPLPAGCPADCSKCPHVAQEPKGCILNVIYYAFCEVDPGSAGGNCPTKQGNGQINTQDANFNVNCTSATNAGGTWNNLDPGECTYHEHFCTAYETTGCAGPYVRATNNVGNRTLCDNP